MLQDMVGNAYRRAGSSRVARCEVQIEQPGVIGVLQRSPSGCDFCKHGFEPSSIAIRDCLAAAVSFLAWLIAEERWLQRWAVQRLPVLPVPEDAIKMLGEGWWRFALVWHHAGNRH